MLSEEPELGDASLYHAVLAAICAGAHKRSDIARTLGRPDSALSHPLDRLERVQLIRKVDDALRARRPIYQVTEPLLRLHHLIIRPFEARLVGRGRAQVWAESADTVASLINGPHLEELAASTPAPEIKERKFKFSMSNGQWCSSAPNTGAAEGAKAGLPVGSGRPWHHRWLRGQAGQAPGKDRLVAGVEEFDIG